MCWSYFKSNYTESTYNQGINNLILFSLLKLSVHFFLSTTILTLIIIQVHSISLAVLLYYFPVFYFHLVVRHDKENSVSVRSGKFMPISFTSIFAKIGYHLHFSCGWLILEFCLLWISTSPKNIFFFKDLVASSGLYFFIRNLFHCKTSLH